MIDHHSFKYGRFIGLISVVCAHLSANLINDKADSEAGGLADTIRIIYSRFQAYTGSGISEAFYPQLRYCCLISVYSVCALAGDIKEPAGALYDSGDSPVDLGIFSQPLQLSYRRMGGVIFVTISGRRWMMGGLFIQTNNSRRKELLAIPSVGFLYHSHPICERGAGSSAMTKFRER